MEFLFLIYERIFGSNVSAIQQPLKALTWFYKRLNSKTDLAEDHEILIYRKSGIVKWHKRGNISITWYWSVFMQPFLKWKSNKYYIFWVCVCRFKQTVCNAHAPFCRLWPPRLYNSFAHYVINVASSSEKKRKEKEKKEKKKKRKKRKRKERKEKKKKRKEKEKKKKRKEKAIEHKCVFWLSLQHLSEKFLISIINSLAQELFFLF